MEDKDIKINKLLAGIIITAGLTSFSCAMTPEANQFYRRACDLAEKSQYNDAIDQLNKAIQLSPDDALLYTKLAGMYSELGQWGNSVEAYKKALKIRPDDAFIYISLGNIYEQMHLILK